MNAPPVPRRLVWIRTDRLGETLLNIPAIVALKACLPRLSLTMLVHETLAPLMRTVPGVEEVVADAPEAEQRLWSRASGLARRLRQRRFDAAVVSNAKKELHAAIWLAGIAMRIGYDRKWSCLLTKRIQDRRALGQRHEVECNLDLVRALGCSNPIPEWPAFRLDVEREEIAGLLAHRGIGPGEPIVAAHPWTSNSAKQWPVTRFRRLFQVAADRAAVVLVGGAEEAGRAPEVMPHGTNRVVNLVGQLSLTHTAALLARSRVLVSNDSGPVHLAAAVQTPTIVLFGSTHPSTGPARWGPWGQGHTVIDRASMDAITVEDVLAALAPFLHA